VRGANGDMVTIIRRNRPEATRPYGLEPESALDKCKSQRALVYGSANACNAKDIFHKRTENCVDRFNDISEFAPTIFIRIGFLAGFQHRIDVAAECAVMKTGCFCIRNF